VRLLVVDDDRMMCQLLKEYLSSHGFEVQVAHTGEEGVAQGISSNLDAIVLDVMLPGIDGFEVIRKIRSRSAVPILMLTARAQERDRIMGLDAGADDYLTKTLSSRELLARIHAVVRRAKPRIPSDVVEAGGIHLDADKRVARSKDVRLELTAGEFDILLALMRANGRVLTREQLLNASERGLNATDRLVDVHISSLRRKLGDEHNPSGVIETVRSLGYRFRDPNEN
jgi:two-component system response regulator CpxR